MQSDTPDLARMRAEMLMQDQPVYGNDGMDMFQGDPNMQPVGLFGKKPPKPPPVELADPARRAFFKLPMQDQLPAVIPSPIAPKPGNLPVVPSQPSPEALMPPTPNVAPPEQQQPGVLETLAEKALSTPMTRRGFLETTAKSAASQALRPKIDLGTFNESPLTSALTNKETYDSDMLASTAAQFVKKQLSGPQFDAAVEKLKAILEDERPEYVELLDEEPSTIFHLMDPYMDELDPELDTQIHNVYRNLLNLDKLAAETGIPANVFRAHGINEEAMLTPLHRVSNGMDSLYRGIVRDGDADYALDAVREFLTDDKMNAVISDIVKSLPDNPTDDDIVSAASDAYDALKDEFITDRVTNEQYEPRDYEDDPKTNKTLYDEIFNVGTRELSGPGESVWGMAQDFIGPFDAFIEENIRNKLEDKPLTSLNEYADDTDISSLAVPYEVKIVDPGWYIINKATGKAVNTWPFKSEEQAIESRTLFGKPEAEYDVIKYDKSMINKQR
jgi:hypothetical protein